jgi:hypothetical protein
MSDPFELKIFFPQGDPNGVRTIKTVLRTGQALYFPRDKWPEAKKQEECQRLGVYILGGHKDLEDGSEDDLPTIYIGQSGDLRKRIDQHDVGKDFWDWGIIFSSSGDDLNKAHADWLEQAMIKKVIEIAQAHVMNAIQPNETKLTQADRANMETFMRDMLQILPLVGIQAFQKPTIYKPQAAALKKLVGKPTANDVLCDMLVVPAKEEGFKRVFLGENRWRAVRISRKYLSHVRYICAYQTAPISAVTYWAEVEKIEPYGDKGKYQLFFKGKAQKLNHPLQNENLPRGFMQGMMYTNFDVFKKA